MGVRGRSPVRDYILILIGASIMGFAIKNIYDPIGLVTGGASGVAIILKKQFGVPLWLTNTAINIPLFAAAAKLKGWSFIKRTLLATVTLSVSLYVIPEMPFLMDDLFLTALFGGLITGAGAGIVFACQATTGGTDMLAAIIRRWLPHYTLAQILQVLDAAIVLIGAGIFGVTYALYALIAIYAVSKVSDGIIEGMKYSKVAYIISDKSEEIAAAILKELERGVTALDARGMYSGNRKNVLFCVVSRKEIAQLKELVVGHDAQAFVIVSDAREVLGEGFIEYRQ
ncbi:YitT family protein [Ventrimonas sp. CLA-AP-H27]|uniref:YitT family protein n=1 Tax=Ventrimonas faecis TaxID=3133170 RepID=A0ABV1HH71_9FIRM